MFVAYVASQVWLYSALIAIRIRFSYRLFDLPVLALINVVFVERISVVKLAGLDRTIHWRMLNVVITLCSEFRVNVSAVEVRKQEPYEQAAAQSAVSNAVFVNSFAPM